MDRSDLRRTSRRTRKAAENEVARTLLDAAGPSNTRNTKSTASNTLPSKSSNTVAKASSHSTRGKVSKKRKRPSNPPKPPAATPCPQSTPSPIDVPSSPPPKEEPEEFEFRVQWFVRRGIGSKREELKADVDRYRTDIGDIHLWDEFLIKINNLVDFDKYERGRVEMVVHSATRSMPNDLKLDFLDSESVRKLHQGIKDFHTERKVAPVVTVSIAVTDKAAAATQVVPLTPHTVVRATPTMQLLADSSDVSPSALQISTKWLCTQKGCKNYQKTCYWQTRDAPEHHFPVQQEGMRSWSAAIAAGTANVLNPPQLVLIRLISNKFQGRTSASDGSSNAKMRRHDGSASNAPQLPSVNVYVGDQRERSNWNRSPPRRPSPELMSSQTCPVDLLSDFFEWCKASKLWHSAEHADLDLMCEFADEGGYDIDGLKNVSVERWKEAELREGHRDRIHASIRRFLVRRRTQRSSGVDDEELYQ